MQICIFFYLISSKGMLATMYTSKFNRDHITREPGIHILSATALYTESRTSERSTQNSKIMIKNQALYLDGLHVRPIRKDCTRHNHVKAAIELPREYQGGQLLAITCVKSFWFGRCLPVHGAISEMLALKTMRDFWQTSRLRLGKLSDSS